MMYSDLMALMGEMRFPFAYHHFAEGESPEPPFLIFLFTSTDNFMADDAVYAEIQEVAIELYTDCKQPQNEKIVEAVLYAHEIPWNKSEVWIEDEKLYEVRYAFKFLMEDEEEDPEEDDTFEDVSEVEESEEIVSENKFIE